MQHLVTAHAVCTETLAADILQQPSLDVCLHGIMYLYAIPFSHFSSMVHRLAQQIHIVIVERSGNLVKFLYNIDIQHLVYL